MKKKNKSHVKAYLIAASITLLIAGTVVIGAKKFGFSASQASLLSGKAYILDHVYSDQVYTKNFNPGFPQDIYYSQTCRNTPGLGAVLKSQVNESGASVNYFSLVTPYDSQPNQPFHTLKSNGPLPVGTYKVTLLLVAGISNGIPCYSEEATINISSVSKNTTSSSVNVKFRELNSTINENKASTLIGKLAVDNRSNNDINLSDILLQLDTQCSGSFVSNLKLRRALDTFDLGVVSTTDNKSFNILGIMYLITKGTVSDFWVYADTGSCNSTSANSTLSLRVPSVRFTNYSGQVTGLPAISPSANVYIQSAPTTLTPQARIIQPALTTLNSRLTILNLSGNLENANAYDVSVYSGPSSQGPWGSIYANSQSNLTTNSWSASVTLGRAQTAKTYYKVELTPWKHDVTNPPSNTANRIYGQKVSRIYVR